MYVHNPLDCYLEGHGRMDVSFQSIPPKQSSFYKHLVQNYRLIFKLLSY